MTPKRTFSFQHVERHFFTTEILALLVARIGKSHSESTKLDQVTYHNKFCFLSFAVQLVSNFTLQSSTNTRVSRNVTVFATVTKHSRLQLFNSCVLYGKQHKNLHAECTKLISSALGIAILISTLQFMFSCLFLFIREAFQSTSSLLDIR